MLNELCVENFLLIEGVRLEPAEGFNAFTGETGAGKSLLVTALAFLFGNPSAGSASSLRRPGNAPTTVTARFQLADPELAAFLREEFGLALEDVSENGDVELVVTRVIQSGGRTKAYCDGRPISLAALRELGDRLVDIHGQHENQSLLRASSRLEILDRFAGASEERAATIQSWRRLHETAVSLAELRRALRTNKEKESFLRYQLQELENAGLDDLDEDALLAEAKLLRSAEQILVASQNAESALAGEEIGAAAVLGRARRELENLGDVGTEVEGLIERLNEIIDGVQELGREAGDLVEKAHSDPAKLQEIEDRLSSLRLLQRQHGRDAEGLRQWRNQLREELSLLDDSDGQIGDAEKSLQGAEEILKKIASKLSRMRKKAAKELEKKVGAVLGELGLPRAVMQIELSPYKDQSENNKSKIENKDSDSLQEEVKRILPKEYRETGAEQMEILFSANPDLSLRPLKECASGGELARVMLALKGVLAEVAGADRLPVVVFDEVDSGVGGRLGGVLGKRLAALAYTRQVFCVTHLPQPAAYADAHWKIEKNVIGKTTSVQAVKLDSEKNRAGELAEMLRGGSAGKQTLAEARAMLREAKNGN